VAFTGKQMTHTFMEKKSLGKLQDCKDGKTKITFTACKVSR